MLGHAAGARGGEVFNMTESGSCAQHDGAMVRKHALRNVPKRCCNRLYSQGYGGRYHGTNHPENYPIAMGFQCESSVQG